METGKGKRKGLGIDVPPALFHVEIYFIANQSTELRAREFFDHYQEKEWLHNDVPIKNWKVLAWQWIFYK